MFSGLNPSRWCWRPTALTSKSCAYISDTKNWTEAQNAGAGVFVLLKFVLLKCAPGVFPFFVLLFLFSWQRRVQANQSYVRLDPSDDRALLASALLHRETIVISLTRFSCAKKQEKSIFAGSLRTLHVAVENQSRVSSVLFTCVASMRTKVVMPCGNIELRMNYSALGEGH